MNGGGSKSQLVVGSDGRTYVVKLIGNPQRTRILANEYVVGKLAKLLDVPSPEVVLIEVEREFVSVVNQRANHSFGAGTAFGSLYAGGDGVLVTPSSPSEMARTSNAAKWPNAIVLDTLVRNEDVKPEHVLIVKSIASGTSEFCHIDHGHCLGVERGWTTFNSSSTPLRAPLYAELVSGESPFQDAIRRLEGITSTVVDSMLADLPIGQWEVPASDVVALKAYFEGARRQVQNTIIAAKSQFQRWT